MFASFSLYFTTRYNILGIQKPGFYEKTALHSAETQKNPVSRLTREVFRNRVFARKLRYTVQKRKKTRFLDSRAIFKDAIVKSDTAAKSSIFRHKICNHRPIICGKSGHGIAVSLPQNYRFSGTKYAAIAQLIICRDTALPSPLLSKYATIAQLFVANMDTAVPFPYRKIIDFPAQNMQPSPDYL